MVNTSTLDLASEAPATGEKQPKRTDATQPRDRSLREPASGEASDEVEALSKDVIFDILKNQRRRHVLSYLRENETTTLSDLAEHVAAVETGKRVEQITSNERKCVYVGLYQCHLPRMSDAGVIEYEQARGTVELLEPSAQLFRYLNLDSRRRSIERGRGLGRARELLVALTSKLRR